MLFDLEPRTYHVHLTPVSDHGVEVQSAPCGYSTLSPGNGMRDLWRWSRRPDMVSCPTCIAYLQERWLLP